MLGEDTSYVFIKNIRFLFIRDLGKIRNDNQFKSILI